MEALTQGAPEGEFRHEAFFYASRDEFLNGAVSFIRDGLAAKEPALVVLRQEKLEALREELGADADRIEFAASVSRSGPSGRAPSWWSASATRRC